jgi:hypothetical protein
MTEDCLDTNGDVYVKQSHAGDKDPGTMCDAYGR